MVASKNLGASLAQIWREAMEMAGGRISGSFWIFVLLIAVDTLLLFTLILFAIQPS